MLLSDTGDELHEPDACGNTVFHLASTSTRHSLDVYDLLLQRYGTGESVHMLWERALTARGYRQQTPLHVAVADNNVDVVQLLLQLLTQLSELEWTSRLLGINNGHPLFSIYNWESPFLESLGKRVLHSH